MPRELEKGTKKEKQQRGRGGRRKRGRGRGRNQRDTRGGEGGEGRQEEKMIIQTSSYTGCNIQQSTLVRYKEVSIQHSPLSPHMMAPDRPAYHLSEQL